MTPRWNYLLRTRTRLVVAVVLVVVVAGVVTVARLAGDDHRGRGASTGAGPATASPSPSASASLESLPADDDVVGRPSDVSPSVRPGVVALASVAAGFAAAWVARDQSGPAWRAGLAPFATPALISRLADTDPAGVPATRVLGSPELVLSEARFADYRLDLDAGRLRVRVILQADGRGLVDRVDWERG